MNVTGASSASAMDSKPVPARLLHASPPYGHILTHEKWRASALLQSFKGWLHSAIFFFFFSNVCILDAFYSY